MTSYSISVTVSQVDAKPYASTVCGVTDGLSQTVMTVTAASPIEGCLSQLL